MQGDQELIIQFQQSENKEAPFTALLKKVPEKGILSNQAHGD